ncbi:MAG TPA: ABC transporter ATP-binding protein [Micromonosporaceae bacterium]
MNAHAVMTQGLRRIYQRRRGEPRVALDGFDLEVQTGGVHGLLGPNGAGKTTLVKILSTVLLPTEGTVRVLGFDVVRQADRIRAAVASVLGGERGLYSHASVRLNLLFWASLYGLHGKAAQTRCDELMERVGLSERADEPVERLSRGMMQRVHLARGLVSDPQLILLDEPTTGLDPVAALEFRKLVKEMVFAGRTVLLTTHDLAEAEALCGWVSVIDHGKLLMTSTVSDVGARLATADRVDFETGDETVVARVRAHPGVLGVEALDVPQRYRAQPASDDAVAEVIRVLLEHGVRTMSTSRPSLEEVYLHVVGERGMAL